jgi:hypothetical protein
MLQPGRLPGSCSPGTFKVPETSPPKVNEPDEPLVEEGQRWGRRTQTEHQSGENQHEG